MVLKETGILLGIVAIIIPLAWFSLDLLIPIFLPNWENGLSAAKAFLFMMPLNILPNYATNVVQSSLVNKQGILPYIQIGSIMVFVIPVLILNHFQILNIEKYILANIAGYAFNVFCLLVLYKNIFIMIMLIKIALNFWLSMVIKKILFLESGSYGGGSFESMFQHIKNINRSVYEPHVLFTNENKYCKKLSKLNVKFDIIKKSPLNRKKSFSK